jgi:hypothetical protein
MNLRRHNKFLLLLICILLNAKCKSNSVHDILSEALENRKGKPEIFFLNGNSFSASTFHDELLYERSVIQKNHDIPKPSEVEQALKNYIEETVILERATSDIDFNSLDAKKFLEPFIRRAAIAYYLEKKSGMLALNENFKDINVSDELIEKYLKEGKVSSLSKLNNEEARIKLKNTAIYVKWMKLRDAADEKKKLIIGKMKKENKVTIIDKEIYNLN